MNRNKKIVHPPLQRKKKGEREREENKQPSNPPIGKESVLGGSLKVVLVLDYVFTVCHKEWPIVFLCIWKSLGSQKICRASYTAEEFLQCVRFV